MSEDILERAEASKGLPSDSMEDDTMRESMRLVENDGRTRLFSERSSSRKSDLQSGRTRPQKSTEFGGHLQTRKIMKSPRSSAVLVIVLASWLEPRASSEPLLSSGSFLPAGRPSGQQPESFSEDLLKGKCSYCERY